MSGFHRTLVGIGIGGFLTLTGCGGGGDGGGNGPGPVASVVVTPGNQSVAVGAQVQYSAVAKDGDGTTISGKTFTWGSSDLAVSGISNSGLAATVAEGVTTISATTDGISGQAQLAVTAAGGGAIIQGTITLSGSFLAPIRPTVGRSAVPDGLEFPKSSPKAVPGAQSISAAVRWVPAQPGAKYVTGEWVVTYRAGALSAPPAGSHSYSAPQTVSQVASRIRAVLEPHLSTSVTLAGVSPALLAARVAVAPSQSEDAVAEQLRKDPAVLTVERNLIRTHFGLRRDDGNVALAPLPPVVRPNDPLYPLQAWHYEMIDLTRAWRTTTGSNTVLVAVIDDGIRFDHPGIAANLTNDGHDFVSNPFTIPICSGGSTGQSGDGDGYDNDPTNPAHVQIDPNLQCIQGVLPSGNHGLHVAGTIGAPGNDGVGVTGVAWNVRIRPVRVLGLAGGSDYDIAQGILYAAGLPADNGAGGTVTAPSRAPIINMSLGGPGASTVGQNAVTAALNAGSLIIAAAGNNADATPNYPASYTEVVSVSAVGPDAGLASYSSFGNTVDVTAPGGDLADGNASYGVMSTAYNYVTGTPIYDNATWNGTSMASPHVAGVVALLLATNPSLTAAQLRTRLETFTIDIGAAGKDDQYGFGLVNARNALTQTNASAATLRVRLINSVTGATAANVVAQPNGSYQFTNVADGSYYVYAGQDEEGDGLIGVTPRRWGAHGGSATPTTVTVAGAGTQTVNFTVGFPIELENNNTLPNADILPVGGYLAGIFANPATDVDVSRVQIAVGGVYTFETVGLLGSCGFALEEDTILELLSSTGSQLAINDDIDTNASLLCSRISTTLTPGTYYLRVAPFTGQGAPGIPNRRYTVSARSGP